MYARFAVVSQPPPTEYTTVKPRLGPAEVATLLHSVTVVLNYASFAHIHSWPPTCELSSSALFFSLRRFSMSTFGLTTSPSALKNEEL